MTLGPGAPALCYQHVVLISPSDHYRLHETVAGSAKELREFIDKVTAIAESTDCEVFWRGQADQSWGIGSSLSRLAHQPTALKDAHLAIAEEELVAEASDWVTATAVMPESRLEWLALLQHHGVPTRMLDFTSDPFTATFFAVESLDDVAGRLFAVAVPRGTHLVSEVEAKLFDIGGMTQGELRVWKPRAEVSPRLIAQHGVFALGRLPSTSPARHVYDRTLERERLMTRSEVVSIASIPLYIVSLTRGENRRESIHPSCFTARIHVDKSSLREQLSKQTNSGKMRPGGDPIDHARCYPDVDGLRTYSRTLERIRRGLG